MATCSIWRTVRMLNYSRCILCNNVTLSHSRIPKFQPPLTSRFLSLTNKYFDENDVVEAAEKVKKKKIFIPRITLISEKNEISIVTMDEAQKLAKRRDMKLVKIVDFDTKTERPVYKLMTIHDFLKEEAKAKAEAKTIKNNAIKEDKTITLSSRIADHDLMTKVKSIHKMIGKRNGVRAVITIDDGNRERAETLRNTLIEKCQDVAKPVTKSDSPLNIKVTLRPIVEKQKKTETIDVEKIK